MIRIKCCPELSDGPDFNRFASLNGQRFILPYRQHEHQIFSAFHAASGETRHPLGMTHPPFRAIEVFFHIYLLFETEPLSHASSQIPKRARHAALLH